ncbi:hypothetical protein, partial [Vibrio sp. 1F169]|uniref:hypothetical protein n=1 Tax=Vibrio sp. 1F169 TaxID=3230005 RepID=UPI00352C3389
GDISIWEKRGHFKMGLTKNVSDNCDISIWESYVTLLTCTNIIYHSTLYFLPCLALPLQYPQFLF